MNSIALTTPEATMMDQHVRNQMSLMAWIMTFLCGWVLFLSAYVSGAECSKPQTPAANVVTTQQ